MFRKLFTITMIVCTVLYAAASADPLSVVSLKEKFDGSRPAVCVTFSRDLAHISATDLSKFFRVSTKNLSRAAAPILSQKGKEICAHELEFGTDYSFGIMRYLSAEGGGSLSHDEVWNLTTASKRPQFSLLDDPGIAGESADPRRLSLFLRSVNIGKIGVAVFSIPDDAVASDIFQSDYKSNIGVEKALQLIHSGGRLVDGKIINIDNQNNTPVISHFSLNYGTATGGTPLIMAFDPIIDDIKGLTETIKIRPGAVWGAKLTQSKSLSVSLTRRGHTVHVEAHSGKTGNALNNARVEFYTKAGKLTASGTTDKYGHCELSAFSKEYDNEPSYALIEADEGSSRIYLPPFENNEQIFDSGDKLNNEGILAVVDKNNYRPGETVHLIVVSRNADLKASGVNSLRAQVISPAGAAVRDHFLYNEGGSSFSLQFKIPSQCNPGRWTIRLSDHNGKLMALKGFNVQSQRASDFSIKSTVSQGDLTAGTDEFIKLKASFRDSSPASGLTADSWLFFNLDRNPFKNYKDYVTGPDPKFHSTLTDFMHFSDSRSNEHGNVSLSFKLPDTGYPLRADIASVISDANGRSSHFIKHFNIKAQNNICALKHEVNSDEVQVKLIDKYGKTVAGRVYFNLFKLQNMGVYEHFPEGWRFDMRRERTLLSSGAVTLSAGDQNQGSIKVPKDGGEYFIRAATQDGIVTELVFVNAFRKIDLLEGELKLAVPKQITWPGDPVEVSFASPYDGNAVVEIESGLSVTRSLMKIKRGDNKFLIGLTKDLGDKATVSVLAFYSRNMRGIMRARGKAVFAINRPDAKLSPSITFSQLPVAGRDVNLNVTGISHKTKTYFAVAVLLEKKTERLSDGMDEMYASSDKDIQTFFYSGIQTSEIAGDNLHFKVPDESGFLHIRLLVWNKYGYSVINRSVEISKPFSMDLDMPDTVNIGDTALAKVRIVNNTSESVRKFKLAISCNGQAKCLLDRSFMLDSGAEVEYIMPVTAAMTTGNAYIRIDGNYDAHYSTKIIPIRVKQPTSISHLTECIHLNGADRRSYTPDQLRVKLKAAVDISPIPFLNRKGYVDALINATGSNILNRLFALSALLDCNSEDLIPNDDLNLFTVLSKTPLSKEKFKQHLQDMLDSLVADLGSQGALQLYSSDLEMRNTVAIKVAQALNAGMRRGFIVNREVAVSCMRRLSEIARGDGSYYDQAMAVWALMESGNIVAAKALTHKLSSQHSIKSPSALALIAVLTAKSGDRRRAMQLLQLGLAQFNAIEDLRIKMNGVADSFDRDMLNQKYAEFGEPVFSSSAYNAAMLMFACNFLNEKDHLPQLIKKLYRNKETITEQTPVFATLMSQLKFVSADHMSMKEFSDKQASYEIKNPYSWPSYATLMIKSYGGFQEQTDPNSVYEGSLRFYNTSGHRLNPNQVVNIKQGNELQMVIEVRAKEHTRQDMKLLVSLSSGLILERFLSVNEPRFPHVDMLYPVSFFRRADNTFEVNVGTNRAKLFRIAAVVRADFPGSFVIPQINFFDAAGNTGVIPVSVNGRINIE